MTSNRFLADDLSRTTFEFGIDLYKLLTNGNSCNIFFSPFSISTLLSLVGMGASGSTARQIGSVLRTPPEQLSSLCLSIKNYLTLIKGTKTDVSLSSASRMYVANRVTVLSDFETKARDIFEASIVKTNFVADPVRVASEINSWVAEKTCNKITNIVSQENLSSVTAMLLINAVHFKGKWTNEFKTSDTKQKPFRKSNHEVNDVSMMTQTDYFRIGQSEDLLCDVIELPYGRRDLSLFIFLPYDVEGLNDLEVKLSSERIRRAMCELVTDEVNLSLPKFCMESSFDLSDVLMSLGNNNNNNDCVCVCARARACCIPNMYLYIS